MKSLSSVVCVTGLIACGCSAFETEIEIGTGTQTFVELPDIGGTLEVAPYLKGGWAIPVAVRLHTSTPMSATAIDYELVDAQTGEVLASPYYPAEWQSTNEEQLDFEWLQFEADRLEELDDIQGLIVVTMEINGEQLSDSRDVTITAP